jgi:hypothetical protein
MLPFWRLDPPYRYAIYAAFTVLFLSGAAWLVADGQKEPAGGEAWQEAAASMLMLHGGAAMVTLMLLGALFPLHIARGWRGKKNRATGIVMIVCNALLIVSAFGLYYLSSDMLRPWASGIHTAAGLSLPLLLLWHIKKGRRPNY